MDYGYGSHTVFQIEYHFVSLCMGDEVSVVRKYLSTCAATAPTILMVQTA